jgi:threonine synthase
MSPGIWKWADRLGDVPTESSRFTLGEGNTPLVPSRRIGPALGPDKPLFQTRILESDRFLQGSLRRRGRLAPARTRRSRTCLATSSGNTGAALAAACAVAGIPLHLAIVEPAPDDKLRQMLAYGAKLSRLRGFGLDPGASATIFAGLRRLSQAARLGARGQRLCDQPRWHERRRNDRPRARRAARFADRPRLPPRRRRGPLPRGGARI